MDDQQRIAHRPEVEGQAEGRPLFTDIDELDPEVDEAGDLLPEDRRPADEDGVTTVPGPGGGNPNQPVVGIGDVAKGTRNP